MGYFGQVARHEDASALAACGWFHDPTFGGGALHVLFKVDKLVRQDVRLRYKAEVFGPMDLPEFGDLAVHQIFSRHVERAWKVVDFLILVKRLIDRFFDRAHGPEECPTAIVILVSVAMVVLNVAEPIVFQRVAYNLNVTIVQIKVVSAVLRQIRPDRDWVLIWTKHQEVPLNFPAQLRRTWFHCLTELDDLLLLCTHSLWLTYVSFLIGRC